mgnify:CR=1 FL=1
MFPSLPVPRAQVRRGAPDVQDPGWNSHSKLNCIAACIQVWCGCSRFPRIARASPSRPPPRLPVRLPLWLLLRRPHHACHLSHYVPQ